MELLGYFFSLLIGFSLGLIGGGGSILTVPILVYLFQVPSQKATSYSLFIVGITAMLGAFKNYKLGNLQLKTALYFAIPSILSLLFIRKMVLPIIPEQLCQIGFLIVTKNALIMLVFALLMIAASLSMIRNSTVVSAQKMNYQRLVLIGLLVGIVTGFLGAGGGFLIIPALVFFAGLSMKQAVGTSLFIIFLNSMIGFGGDMLNGVELNYTLLFTITAIALVGMMIGSEVAKKIDGAKLKPIFGWFVLVMGCYILIKELMAR